MQLLNSKETAEQVLFRLKHKSCTAVLGKSVTYTKKEVSAAKKVLFRISQRSDPYSFTPVINVLDEV